MRSRLISNWVLVVLSAVLLVGTSVPAAAQTTADRPLTFTKDIAPILQRSCQQCHRPDSVAPMSLITYQQVRPYARAIKDRTQRVYVPGMRGVMPPWFLERNIGIQHIRDDSRLTEAEITRIATWVDSGAPEGNPADLPAALVFADNATWALGKPDLLVSSPEVTVQPLAPDWYGVLDETPTDLAEDRYAASAEYKETSNLKAGSLPRAGEAGMGKVPIFVFHHNFLSVRRPGEVALNPNQARDVDRDDESGGVAAFAPYSIGRNSDVFASDIGKLIPAKGIFGWDLHVHAPGVAGAAVRKAVLNVGFKFHPKGWQPKYKEGRRGDSVGGSNELEIRPENDRNRYDTYVVTTTPLKILNYDPHMHAAGLRMCLEALYPGFSETLNCAGYDHNWVRNYDYDENWMPLIPKGTVLHHIGWFDGTAKNANNIDARNISISGRRTVQNMFSEGGNVIQLTEEQYQQELAARREYLTRTNSWNEVIGCPECFNSPATASAKPPQAGAGR